MTTIPFILASLLGAFIMSVSMTIFRRLEEKRRWVAHAQKRLLEVERFGENAIAKAEDLRGAAARLPYTIDGSIAWAIAAPTIRNAADYAAAAIAYGLADSPPPHPVNVDRLGLNFALWWYGLDPSRSPHPDLNAAWRKSGEADPISARRDDSGDVEMKPLSVETLAELREKWNAPKDAKTPPPE